MKKIIAISALVALSLSSTFAADQTIDEILAEIISEIEESSVIDPNQNANFSDSELQGAQFLADKGFINNNANNPELYRVSGNITRKEMMKIILNISGVNVTDTCTGDFQDVSNDWGCKYIEAALRNDFIAKNDMFRPDDNITKAESMKLLFKARGLEKTSTSGTWQDQYFDSAVDASILSMNTRDYNVVAKRGWIFDIAENSY